MIQLYSLKRKTVRPCAKSANKMAADTARAVQKSFTVKVNVQCVKEIDVVSSRPIKDKSKIMIKKMKIAPEKMYNKRKICSSMVSFTAFSLI